MSKPTYRQSSIADFLKCGIYYQFRHKMGLQVQANSSRTVGSVSDQTFNHILIQKMAGKEVTVQEALAVASDNFEKARPETVWDEPADSLKDATLSIVKVFVEQVAPKIQPVAVQETFTHETPEYFLTGTLDYRESSGVIGDAKTSSPQRASSYQVNHRLQPAMYWWATHKTTGIEPTGFRFDIITRTTTRLPDYRFVEGKVTETDIEDLFYAVNRVHTADQAGIYLPAMEGSWQCTKKWCPFWDKCKGRKS